MSCNVGTQKLTLFYDPPTAPLITVPIEKTKGRLSLRTEQNRRTTTGLTAVGILKSTRSSHATLFRWVVDGVVDEAGYLALERILDYEDVDTETLLVLRDEAKYMPDWKAADVSTRLLVAGSTVTVAGMTQSYYDFTAWLQVREEEWATQVSGGLWNVKLELLERLT